MLKLFFIVLSGLTAFALNSCSYDNENSLYPELVNECDTTDIRYSNTIKPIINNNCLSCHGNNYMTEGAGLNLATYDNVKNNINIIVQAINHTGNLPKMPKNAAKLSDCDLKKIDIWVKNATPNN